mmetsp:Transcript_11302/g.21144  ORF Transcript_11302/g.21144 Transcript_11302/m.21144 type:complete len:1511 (+) Transcript_11302:160-4692(+)
MSHFKARRKYGACYGSLWKQHTPISTPLNLSDFKKEAANDKGSVITITTAFDKNERSKSYEFCVLIGNTMTCYENLTAFRRGDDPSSEIRIVGASAWNPPVKCSDGKRPLSPPPPSSAASSAAHIKSFRLLTHAGTDVFCSTQNYEDCEVWLAALHSGLEITYAGYQDTLTILKKLQMSPEGTIVSFDEEIDVAPPRPPKSLRAPDASSLEPKLLTPPLARRSSRMKNLVNKVKTRHDSAQSLCLHNAAFLDPYTIPSGVVLKTHCICCGRYPPENAMKSCVGTPLPQFGLENRVQICQPCIIGQGILRHVYALSAFYASDAHERVALMKGRDLAVKIVENATNASGTRKSIPEVSTSGSFEALDNVTMTPAIASAIMNMVNGPNFAACRRRSSALNLISYKLESGTIGAAEFLELLNEYALEAIASSTLQTATIQMKKEALMVSGDMRAAIEMLHEHALPKSSSDGYGIASSGSTEMLSCILEFFLDLCEQGELSSVAFFWPQLCQIHLQMLPATDSESLARIELVEDFLLTVCVKNSVHLALELVWSCIADLEESTSSSTPTPSCRRRRFALMRFLCELESLIFDLEGGWGGGSVCLRGLMTPSEHQSSLIKESMGILQLHRRFSSHHLSRSARLEKLNAEAAADEDSNHIGKGISEEIDLDAAKRKYEIANVAEYFSTQLMFCRRLGDIAEKLRFMNVEERADVLENELEILNSSGRLGGDPLNHICRKNGEFVNVLKIPTNEGHVFRSKERTPVLLLMEIKREENISLEGKNDSDPTVDSKVENATVESNDTSHDEKDEISCSSFNDSNKEDPNLTIKKGSLHDDLSMSSPKVSHLKQVLKSPKATKDDSVGAVAEVENLVADAVREKLKISFPDLTGKNSHLITQEWLVNNDKNGQTVNSDSDCKDDNDKQNGNNHNGEEQGSASFPCNIYDETDCDTTEFDAEGTISVNSTRKDMKCLSITTAEDPTPIRRVSAFGALRASSANSLSTLCPDNLTPHGEGRRQVLTAIFTKGQRSTNLIARGIAPAARRAIQAMDRKRAQLLMNSKHERDSLKLKSNGYSSQFINLSDIRMEESVGEVTTSSTEEEECIEAIRLLLVQNSVALGRISPEKAARALNPALDGSSDNEANSSDKDSNNETDVGRIDSRLAGCGTVSEAVLSALELWKKGLVSNAELLDLIQKDLQYTRLALPGADNESKLKEDSAFWGRFAFGERWAEKKARIQASSVYGTQSGWDLTGVIVKSNDDLRQEAFAMQLIELCAEAFDMCGLELWTYPYRILATGKTTGIIEMVRNSMSFDSLKKRPGYESGGLIGHFKKMAEYAADPVEALKTSKKNFVRSLAAYSLLSYLFLFKDRHNGNLLLDTAGHVIHIDFGFIFGIAPGGSFSLEQSVPFKLTEEMIEVMDGLGSVLFSEFVTLFCCGFLALQAHCQTFETIVGITCEGSTFKCFEGKDSKEITSKLRERFCPNLSKEETVSHAMELIRLACNATGTKQYDFFQYMSQGIAA